MTESLLVEAQANFSVNLLREVTMASANVNGGGQPASAILSPISVAIALAMVYAGAQDETSEEMGQLLAGSASIYPGVLEYFGDLGRGLLNNHDQGKQLKNYTLELANKVYVQRDLSIRDSYNATIEQQFDGNFESVNFTEAEEAAEKINSFVEKATHEKIKQLVSARAIGGLRLILVNAVYFKGSWLKAFNPCDSRNHSFYTGENASKEMLTMYRKDEYLYASGETYRLLGLPYAGEDGTSMYILLPNDRFGLARVLANLTGQELFEQIKSCHKQEVLVAMPKFKLESKHLLNDPLKRLGLYRAFSGHAQLGGITADEQLQISQVFQKAMIEVNEEGTEAAAATAIEGGIGPSAMESFLSFIVDEPFAFFLVASGERPSVLFNGVFYG